MLMLLMQYNYTTELKYSYTYSQDYLKLQKYSKL